MAEVIPDIERANSVTSGLRRLAESSRTRVAPVTSQPHTTTLPDGRVLDRAGKVIYTPTPREVRKP